MRKIGFVPLLCLPAFAAFNGTVMNRTTGHPLPGATVTLYGFGQGGMEPVDHNTTDAQGKFVINREVSGGPAMLRVEVDDVNYNHMIRPGMPTTNVTLDVYNASKHPGAAKVSKHMILFQPSGGQMVVTETFLVENPGKTTWNNPAEGTLHFYLPKAANGALDAKANAPDGLPVPAPTAATSRADVYAVKFEVKPGETRFDLSYTVPYTEGQPYEGKVVSQDDNTYLIAPNGVTMQADGVSDLGEEPRSQAHIYGLKTNSYKVELTGAVAAAPAASDSGDQADSGPQIEEIMPRVYDQAKLILGLALGILALGFALLYRAKENNHVK